MIFPYWDEITLRHTKYDDNWKSEKLADDPSYTEDLQAVDRWVKRCLELYKNQAYNAVVLEQHERELKRRNRLRKVLRLHVEKTYGNEVPESISEDFYDYLYSEAPRKESVNHDFDENWMDEDLKKRGLYLPGMELIKQYLKLCAQYSVKENCDKLREQVLGEEILSIINDDLDDEPDTNFPELLEKYDEEL